MDELETKLETLENENEDLKKQLERVDNVEVFGNNIAELKELEGEKEELAARLAKEVERRENVEAELFKIEEEYENSKLSAEKDETSLRDKIRIFEKEFSELRSEIGSKESTVRHLEGEVRQVLRDKHMVVEEFESEKEDLYKRIDILEKVRKL